MPFTAFAIALAIVCAALVVYLAAGWNDARGFQRVAGLGTVALGLTVAVAVLLFVVIIGPRIGVGAGD